jgi:hypothetical protein
MYCRCMNRTLLLSITVLTGACASISGREDPTESLVQAERDFAANGSRLTVHEAFMSVLADDATLFRPGPVNARASLAGRAMNPELLLLWAPYYGEASADGRLGVTTGPSEYGQRPAARSGSGHFLSVWRRVGSQWRLVADAGIDSPLPISIANAANTLVRRNGERSYPADVSMMAAESALIADYRKNFPDLADETVRVYRNGTPPTTSRVQAVDLVVKDEPFVYQPAHSEVAGSNDLGYVYGTISIPGRQTVAATGYLRIWRRDAEGNWKIAFDWHG